jgi:hypothetical protein
MGDQEEVKQLVSLVMDKHTVKTSAWTWIYLITIVLGEQPMLDISIDKTIENLWCVSLGIGF